MHPAAASPSPLAARPTLATLLIVLASVGFGAVPYFARGLTEAGIASPVIALCRFALIAVLLAPLSLGGLRKGAAALWATGAGLALGLGWIGYVEALKVAPVATAAVVYMSYPLFALMAAWLLLGQRPAARSLAGGGLILAAAALALSPQATGALGALLVSLSAPITFGAAIAILTGKLQALTPIERVFFASLGSCAGLLPLALGLDAAAWPKEAGQWGLILGIAVVTALVPQLVYVAAAPAVGAARAAMAGSFELPTMFLVGWLAFGEALTAPQIMGGLMVVAAIAITPPLSPPATVAPAVARKDDAVL